MESSQGIIVPGVWYHAAIIHDQATREMKLLVHNARKERIDEQTGSYPDGAGLVTGTYDLLIGKKTTLTSYLDGCVDELRISRSVRDFNAVWSGRGEKTVTDDVSINVYPNPASENINLSINNPDVKIKQIRIINIEGKVVRELTMPNSNIRINTHSLKPGVYFLVAYTGRGRLLEKVVIK